VVIVVVKERSVGLAVGCVCGSYCRELCSTKTSAVRLRVRRLNQHGGSMETYRGASGQYIGRNMFLESKGLW
jgi:hypothetical protein